MSFQSRLHFKRVSADSSAMSRVTWQASLACCRRPTVRPSVPWSLHVYIKRFSSLTSSVLICASPSRFSSLKPGPCYSVGHAGLPEKSDWKRMSFAVILWRPHPQPARPHHIPHPLSLPISGPSRLTVPAVTHRWHHHPETEAEEIRLNVSVIFSLLSSTNPHS